MACCCVFLVYSTPLVIVFVSRLRIWSLYRVFEYSTTQAVAAAVVAAVAFANINNDAAVCYSAFAAD